MLSTQCSFGARAPEATQNSEIAALTLKRQWCCREMGTLATPSSIFSVVEGGKQCQRFNALPDFRAQRHHRAQSISSTDFRFPVALCKIIWFLSFPMLNAFGCQISSAAPMRVRHAGIEVKPSVSGLASI